jgi:tetrapyrrole methylase family protein / MazG family protein
MFSGYYNTCIFSKAQTLDLSAPRFAANSPRPQTETAAGQALETSFRVPLNYFKEIFVSEPTFDELVQLIHKLRSPGGCPWDREQTHHSLKPMLLEEAYEVIEAIDEGDDGELSSELGDLLIQVIFHADIAAAENRFAIGEVIKKIYEKMVRRHPHVFGDEAAHDSAEVLKNWEAIKAAEKKAAGLEATQASMLDSVSPAMPAVMEAFQLTTRAARVHFDWPNVGECFDKLAEEVDELNVEIARPVRDVKALSDEVGDLLFIAVNIARLLDVDPESALKGANRKFRRRFKYIETALAAEGKTPAESNLAEMEAYWQEAKQHEKI